MSHYEQSSSDPHSRRMHSSHLNSDFADNTFNAPNTSALAPYGQPSFQHQISSHSVKSNLVQSGVPDPVVLEVLSHSDPPRNHHGAQSYHAQGSDISQPSVQPQPTPLRSNFTPHIPQLAPYGSSDVRQRSVQPQPPSLGSDFIPHIPQSAPYNSWASGFDQDLMLPDQTFITAASSNSGRFHISTAPWNSGGFPIIPDHSHSGGLSITPDTFNNGGVPITPYIFNNGGFPFPPDTFYNDELSQFTGLSSNVTSLINISPSNHSFEAPAHVPPTFDPSPYAYGGCDPPSPLGIGFGQMDDSLNNTFYDSRSNAMGQRLQIPIPHQSAPNSVSSIEPAQGFIIDLHPSQVEMQADPIHTAIHDLPLMQYLSSACPSKSACPQFWRRPFQSFYGRLDFPAGLHRISMFGQSAHAKPSPRARIAWMELA